MKDPLVRYQIHRMDVWPVVRMAFFLSALLGALFGLASSVVFVLFSSLVRTIFPGDMAGQVSSALAPLTMLLSLVWAPICGTFGALLAALGVSLYNLITRWSGGITVHLNEVGPSVPIPPSMDVSSHA